MIERSIKCLGPHGFHRLVYSEWPGPKGAPVLLCVHGLTRNGRDFDTVAEGLSAHYRVVCPDMPGRGPPDLEEARSALNRIVTASHHASEVFDNLRALFGNTDQRKEPLDVNELVLGALRVLRGELDDHGVTPRTELASELPPVMGHRGQLQEVLLNLARNAIEAMDAIEEGSRVLRVRTQYDNHDAITVAVEDTGLGIDPEKLDGIFDVFVTTKAQGMGLA